MKNSTMSTIAECLVFNNRFASDKLTADQLGAELHKSWVDSVKALHSAAYSVAVKCENDHAQSDAITVDKTALYTALRAILATIGDVNGHKLYANDALATLIIGYANRRANQDSPELQFVRSQISNNKKTLATYETTAGVNPETIQNLKDSISALEEKRDALIAEADNRIKVVTRTSFNAFRLDVEHALARAISEQNAKTWDELEAEVEARRQARRANTKAKKNAKASK